MNLERKRGSFDYMIISYYSKTIWLCLVSGCCYISKDCRLIGGASFYQPEAAHLGNLLRL